MSEAPLPPAARTSAGTRVLRGIRYAELPRVRPLELDLYLPEARDATVPVVLHLHGGAWRTGTSSGLPPTYVGTGVDPIEDLVSAGFAVASADYRLSGEASWPAQLDDVRAAVRWLHARSTDCRIDAERVGAWGESAGAHLALLLGLALHDLSDAADPDQLVTERVSAVAAWFPPTDLLGLPLDQGAQPGDPETPEALLLGQPASDVPDTARDASPLTHVCADAPPVLLLHGENDTVIPVAQSRRLAAALAEAGNAVQLTTYPDADHVWAGSPAAAAQAAAATTTFFRDFL